ncbi:helix-turn-helix transcriptional regulator [Dactylosporangium sp. NPDC000555]|uniref:helix-turn-helix domain-containing protein n=1 Tax=Dactylosporangium sp. NPDC000555 TaxID=3154260 RepID=UPI00333440A8
MINDHGDQISATTATRLIELRERLKLTRDAVAVSAREHGAPASFTAAVLRNIETGRPDAAGNRRRMVSVDELVVLAAALDVSPLELIDTEYAELFGAQTAPVPAPATKTCERCASISGGVQSSVREDVDLLGALEGVEPSLAELAFRLAQAIDDGGGEDGRQMPALAKELRSTLLELRKLTAARRADDDDDDDFGPE